MPPTTKELFKWCKFYFYCNNVISPIINKLAAYPLTDLIFIDENEELKERWRELLEDVLDIKSFLINVGLDYYTFGNSFMSIYFPFQRFGICMGCERKEKLDAIKDWELKDGKWRGYCEHCKCLSPLTIEDKPVRDAARINLVRWNPQNIDILHNEVSGSSRYYYNPSTTLINLVKKNKKEVIAELPIKFIEAILKEKAVELHSQNVLHTRRVGLADEDQGWGKPLLLPALKDAFQLQILRKANEAISLQHIVPMTVLFPEAHPNLDVFKHINMQKWRERVEEEVMKWRDDINHIPIMPIPIGKQQIYGEGKLLLVTPEARAIAEQMVTGMGVPQEFLFGGLQYSGSSVSLRMLENQMLRHIEMIRRVLRFVQVKLRRFLRWPDIQVKFKDFKMADDAAIKQLAADLMGQNKISAKSFLPELGYDADIEQKNTKEEMSFFNKIQTEQMITQARAQAESQKIMASQQVESQIEQQERMQKYQEEQTIKQEKGMLLLSKEQQEQKIKDQQAKQQQAQMAQMALQGGQPGQVPQGQPQGQPPQQGGQLPQAGGSGGPGAGRPPAVDNVTMASTTASQLLNLAPEERERILAMYKQRFPDLYPMILASISQLEQKQSGTKKINPMPEQKPPRRN